MTVGMTMTPMAGLKMTIVIMTWNDCDLAGDDVCDLYASDGHFGGGVGPAMYHKYKRFPRIDLVVGIDGGGDGGGGGGGGGGGVCGCASGCAMWVGFARVSCVWCGGEVCVWRVCNVCVV